MKLVIISHTEHYQKDGKIFGWGATVREIDQLSKIFSRVIHVAPLYGDEKPNSALEYQSYNVKLVPVTPSGGNRVLNKLRVFFLIPQYAKVILREIKTADVVHVRCPANISLIAIILLAFIKNPRKRWIKYAGNWQRYHGEALSYSFQKWWLRNNLARAVVTVNGERPNQLLHIHSFYNPCLSKEEYRKAENIAAAKEIEAPIKLIFVGRLEEEKGVGRVLAIGQELDRRGMSYEMDLIGDGPERSHYEKEARKLLGVVRFHGWLSRKEINFIYEKAHLILLPSKASEGWPKVLSEAMAYGVVPLASDVSSIPQYLNRFQTGKALPLNQIELFTQGVCNYLENPEVWKQESIKAIQASKQFTYELYLQRVKEILTI